MKTRKSAKIRRGGASRAPEKSISSSGFRLTNSSIEQALVAGTEVETLERYFGEEAYAELRALARQSAARSVRGGRRVLILPGTMGTKLGVKKGGLFGFDDTLWLDPAGIARGHLLQLSLRDGNRRIGPLEPILLFYLKLKLRLRATGFAADFWGYDWRHNVVDTAKRLAEDLKKEPAGEVALVAHSMGGLVARAALKLGAPNVSHLLMLGTPNHGSYMATQAIRATLGSVRKLAALDFAHTAEELCEKSFNTFPSTYQLLPAAGKFTRFDVFDASLWPAGGAKFDPALLTGARKLQASLAPADERFHLVAGVNQDTATDLDRVNGEFVYTQSSAGDGTVPLALARLDGAVTWYVEEEHGSLPNNAQVARGVIDLLNSGATTQLAREWQPTRGAEAGRKVSEAELRAAVPEVRTRSEVSAREARNLLTPLLSPEPRSAELAGTVASVEKTPLAASSPATPRPLSLDRVVVGRQRQRRLEICVAQGDITEVNARAIVLGLFREVAPGGPALALDERLGGAIQEFIDRRMFGANVGELFILPTGRHPVQAEMVLFAGLGAFDTFNLEVLQLVAENVIRTMIRTHVEDLATVMLGSGTGIESTDALRHILEGFVKGLREGPENGGVRRVTFCVRDPARCSEVAAELYRLAGTDLFADLDVNFDLTVLPAIVRTTSADARGREDRIEPVYLIARQETASSGSPAIRTALLTAGAKAAVITGQREFDPAALEDLLAGLGTSRLTPASALNFGRRLGEMLLAPEVIAVLPTMFDRPLVVVHDALAARIPWELLALGETFPVLRGGLSRRYLADNLSVAKWLETRRSAAKLKLLLVTNPNRGERGHLDGAEREGARIRDLFSKHPLIEVTERAGPAATRARLLQDFRSGEFDVVHFAGHAFFDRDRPARSGIVCRGEEVLSGADLAVLGSLPNLVVFNACESGRIRSVRPRAATARSKTKTAAPASERGRETTGLAEAFLRGGIVNYVGTYWPVNDDAAEQFAGSFYESLLRSETVGQALAIARKAVREKTSGIDWADYLHYGDLGFILKKAERSDR